VELIGRQIGYCVEFRMRDFEGDIEGMWWTYERHPGVEEG
jgi:hypothetical protein